MTHPFHTEERRRMDEDVRAIMEDEIMSDILEKLRDLRLQATKERTHYYVASCVDGAVAEITTLRAEVETLKEAMTDAYLLGSKSGKDALRAENARLREVLVLWRKRLRGLGSVDMRTLLHMTDAALKETPND